VVFNMLKKQREKPFFLKQSVVGSADKAPFLNLKNV
jgi:hypothetical protein